MLKDLARALSLANLCFITAWVAVLDTTYNIPGLVQYLGLIIDVLLLGMVFFSAIRLTRRTQRPLPLKLARLIFPLTLLIPLNGVIQILAPEKKAVLELIVLVLAIAIISLSDVKPWDRRIVQTAATITLLLFPFFLITMWQAAWSLTQFSDKPKPTSNTSGTAMHQRVIWLVFDELDYQIAFANRPEVLQLPELDRLRRESLFALNAYPPGDRTGISMPALISGRQVEKSDPVSPSRIMITFAGSQEPVNWGSEPNLFSEARSAGFNTALIGWYIPYCRVIGESLTSCVWRESGPTTLPEGMFSSIESLVETVPLSSILQFRLGIKQTLDRRNHLKVFNGVLESARNAVIDPNLNLIMVHMPVPHPPGIYNRRTSEFQLDGGSSYLDNVQLADRALGELRKAMEGAGTWNDAAVLATSDHGWRTETWRGTAAWVDEDETALPAETDHRVPFILKPAGKEHSLEYNAEFNTILTHDLLLALLSGELTGTESVADWLNRRQSPESHREPATEGH